MIHSRDTARRSARDCPYFGSRPAYPGRGSPIFVPCLRSAEDEGCVGTSVRAGVFGRVLAHLSDESSCSSGKSDPFFDPVRPAAFRSFLLFQNVFVRPSPLPFSFRVLVSIIDNLPPTPRSRTLCPVPPASIPIFVDLYSACLGPPLPELVVRLSAREDVRFPVQDKRTK